ncbi:hypothetical protein LZZ85_22140 [Terrimonas sp. NA20]|uniref:DUF2474 domain-containing protein n=1 Tax=Terrimonas ginsenosidimutans TaxID=2908004 RepID=A0ABS9KXP3_9BACT|nr:hypothetical protein [Terrimonas ginsenosidimutans]MCG2617012.1 hypothetical protein [Terrimonas ginsenosidimutans]
MVRPYHWYDPMLTRRMRALLTALIWVAWLTILLLQYDQILRVLISLKRYL